MRPRKDGERGQPFGHLVGDTPRHLATPIVTDEVKTLALGARSIGNVYRIVDQLVESIVGKIRRIGPGVG